MLLGMLRRILQCCWLVHCYETKMATSIMTRSGFLKSVRSAMLLTNRPLHSFPKRCLHSTSLLRGKLYPTDDELYTKTSVSLLSKESKDVPYISKFSARGFTISDDIIVGPVAILPWSLVHWNVADVRDINKESLSLFHLLEPRIEILVIGVGSSLHRLDPDLHKFMRSRGIAMEVQVTSQACSTFNFLVGEGRVVAAGLIPPEQ